MECRQCASPLERPGDYCLVCRSANADAVVLDVDRDEARLTMVYESDVVGTTTVTTTPDEGEKSSTIELRNFAGRIADEIQRKRPDVVYASGDREVVRETRAQSHVEFLRVNRDEPVEAVLDRRGERTLDVVDTPPAEKLGGSHTTLIGGRAGMRVVETVAGHPHVKKVIPGPIEAGGSSSRGGTRAKVTRADGNGNLRLLLRDGSSVQENRIVTTAMDRETGERVREDLNKELADADFQ